MQVPASELAPFSSSPDNRAAMSPADTTAAKPATTRARWMVLLVWVLVAVVYFNLSYDYIRVTMNDDKFVEYLQYVVQVAGTERRPAREVRALLLVKAEELELPIRGEQIAVKGSGTELNVVVGYEVDIQIPILERGFYRKQFQHKAEFSQHPGL